jgi:hippurate hydrolase
MSKVCSRPVDIDRFVRQRRDLHAHPELAGEERRTEQIIAKLLAEWGYQVHTGIGGHGVVGLLQRGHGAK